MSDEEEPWPSRSEVEECSNKFRAKLNSSHCFACNYFYGDTLCQPICHTCHTFLYSGQDSKSIPVQRLKKVREGKDDSDHDSGNDEPYVNLDYLLRRVTVSIDLKAIADKKSHAGALENGLKKCFYEPAKHPEPRESKQKIPTEAYKNSEDEKSKNGLDQAAKNDKVPDSTPEFNNNSLSTNMNGTLNNAISNNQVEAPNSLNIQEFPPEILLYIFSNLDEFSLHSVSRTCRAWSQIIASSEFSLKWKNFVRKRWPLFVPIMDEIDWYGIYNELVESSFCRTCIFQMTEPSPVNIRSRISVTRNRLRHDLRGFDAENSPEGIRAVPLESHYYHWQGTISGPPKSPYEGGMFFLYIRVPLQYPFKPPEVRFLTRIFHPNVSRHGDIGIDSIYPQNWVSGLTIAKVLLSIQSLLTDPFPDVCMEPEIGSLYSNRRKLFDAVARHWTWKYAMLDTFPTRRAD